MGTPFKDGFMSKTSKEILLSIAFDEFASFGYEKSSIRNICYTANVNVSSISYYFNNKDGLYSEVIKESINKINEYLNPVLQEYKQKSDSVLDKKQAFEILNKIIRCFLEGICVPKFPENIVKIYLQEYTNPTRFFLLFEENLNKIYIPVISKLLIETNDRKISDKEAAIYVFILFSQIFNLSVRKNSVLKLINEKSYTDKDIEMFVKIISSSVLFK